jgi:hypothetical protein
MTAVKDPQQARDALLLANDTRLGVATLKREIRALPQHEAVLVVIDALEHRHDDPLLGAARVRHLLCSVTYFGDVRARKLIQAAQVYNGDKRLRELTARQRGLLVDLLIREGWKKPRRRS